MATTHELADTVAGVRSEMARRIDELVNDGDMNASAAASMSGIIEWLGSVEDAVRRCDGRPSRRHARPAPRAARPPEDASDGR